jgi:hypothetical protein
MEHYDIAAMHRAVWQNAIQKPAAPITQFVHEKIIADQQGILHGFRGNLKSLNDEGNYKNRDHYRGQQRLQ